MELPFDPNDKDFTGCIYLISIVYWYLQLLFVIISMIYNNVSVFQNQSQGQCQTIFGWCHSWNKSGELILSLGIIIWLMKLICANDANFLKFLKLLLMVLGDMSRVIVHKVLGTWAIECLHFYPVKSMMFNHLSGLIYLMTLNNWDLIHKVES